MFGVLPLGLQTYEAALLVCAAIVAICAFFCTLTLMAIRREIYRALNPTLEQRLARLDAQTKANSVLIDTKKGRSALVNFFTSELHVAAFFKQAEDEIDRAESTTDAKMALERMRSAEGGTWDRSIEWLKRGAKGLGGKLIDKANDFVKPFLGGGQQGGK